MFSSKSNSPASGMVDQGYSFASNEEVEAIHRAPPKQAKIQQSPCSASYTNSQPAHCRAKNYASSPTQNVASRKPVVLSCVPPCSNSVCGNGSTNRQLPSRDGLVNSPPPVLQSTLPSSTPPPAPVIGSEEWQSLASNRYGDSSGLAICDKDSAGGLLLASYEYGLHTD
jgi:hypothetical protein